LIGSLDQLACFKIRFAGIGWHVRKRYTILILVAGLAGVSLLFRHSIVDKWEVQRHLSNLEYWQRIQFGNQIWRDALNPASWGRQRDPQVEIAKESAALQSLGYLVMRSFAFHAMMTNQGGYASLERAIRSAPLSDSHWEYGCYSNRIDAVICAADLQAWETLVRNWQNERARIDRSAFGKQSIK
jgi:hypothetical protein